MVCMYVCVVSGAASSVRCASGTDTSVNSISACHGAELEREEEYLEDLLDGTQTDLHEWVDEGLQLALMCTSLHLRLCIASAT